MEKKQHLLLTKAMVLLAILVLLALYALYITGLGSKLMGVAQESLQTTTKMTCTLPHNGERVTASGKTGYFASRYSSTSGEGKTEDGRTVTCSSLSGVRVGNQESVKYSGPDVQYAYGKSQYTTTHITYDCFGGDCSILAPKNRSFEKEWPPLISYLICFQDGTYHLYYRNLTALRATGEYTNKDYLEVLVSEESGRGCPKNREY